MRSRRKTWLLVTSLMGLVLVLANAWAAAAAWNWGMIGSVTLPTHAAYVGLEVRNGYAYVAGMSSGLRVIDVSDPTAPVEVGSLATWQARALDIQGDYLYLGDSESALRVIDIGNPATPIEVGAFATQTGILGVRAQGNYVYLAAQSAGLMTLDVSQPNHPTLVSYYYAPGIWVQGVDVVGNYAYLTGGFPDGPDGVRVVDISNPTQPQLVGTFDRPGAADITVVNQRAYVVDGYLDGDSLTGLFILDVSDPAHPRELGRYATPDVPTNEVGYTVTVNGDYAYWASDKAMRIFDVSDPAHPVQVAQSAPTNVRKALRIGAYLYVNAYSSADTFRIYVQDDLPPTNPTTVAESHGAQDGVWQNQVAAPEFDWSGASDDVSGVRGYYWSLDADPTGTPTTWLAHSGLPADTQHVGPVAPSEGVSYLRVATEDVAGNQSDPEALFTFRYDATSPSNPTGVVEIYGAQDGEWTTTVNDPAFTWTGAGDALSGVEGYFVYFGTDSGGTSTQFSVDPGYDPPAETFADSGTYYLRLQTRDVAGNLADWQTAFTFRLSGEDDGDGLYAQYEDLDGDGELVDDDTDGDGVANYQDLDDDGDGVPTADEAADPNGDGDPGDARDTDGDGVPDYLDADDDGDGIATAFESPLTGLDTDGDGLLDYLDDNDDGDLRSTAAEDADPNGDGDPADALDTDGDGIPDYLDADDGVVLPDADGDGIADLVEGMGDADGDGVPNYLDEDSDGDGILDSVEGTGDRDGDGIPNYLDLDSDGDGLADATEDSGDVDGDGVPNYLDANDDDGPLGDLDGDVITNHDEDTAGSSTDFDGDGVPNRLDDDSDDDGIPDSVEAGDDDPATPPVDTDGQGFPDFIDPDSDGDGIPDSEEGTGDPDGDGVPNYLDPDSDGDGIPDSVEGTGDPDGDGIPNYLDDDSNGDGVPDSQQCGTPPACQDADGDGEPDYTEVPDGPQRLYLPIIVRDFMP